MEGSRNTKIVSGAILALIVLFALLIAYNVIERGREAPASGPAGAGAAGPMGQDGAARPGGENGAPRPGGGNGPGGAGTMSRSAAVVRVTPVVPGTIENSVMINGDVLARNQVSILPTVAGKLVEALYSVGDRVNRGDVVAMVDPSRPGEVYSWSPVVSTISGTVL
ncbi:MAG: hypothetical protein LBJ90_06975, partial [Treponema sp.]|nr:hypothetical protein [Treponema sp.]